MIKEFQLADSAVVNALALSAFDQYKDVYQDGDGHNAWLKDGFAQGLFLLAGTIQPKLAGAILAHNATLEQFQDIVAEDPFVAEGVVSAEIFEITPSKSVSQLEFLLQ